MRVSVSGFMRYKVFSVLVGIILATLVAALGVPAAKMVEANPEPATVEVSQPIQLTTDQHHDRNASFVLARDGTWWLFFARGRKSPAPDDPDDDMVSRGGGYDIAYLKSTNGGQSWVGGNLTIPDLGTAHGAIWPAALQDSTGALWVFYAILGPTADVYHFKSTDGGGNWTGPTATGINATKPVTNHHMDAAWWNNQIWVVIALDKVYAFNSTDASTWGGPYQVSADNVTEVATPRIMTDGDTMRVAYFGPDGVHLASSSNGTAWEDTLVTASGETDFDPALAKLGDTYYLFWAPAERSSEPHHWHQWIMVTTSQDLTSWSTPRHVTAGSYGNSEWWDYWAEPAAIGSELLLFYSSLKKGTTWGDSNIFMLPVDWDVSNDHFEAIQPAIDFASGGDTIRVAAGTYDEQVVINKSLTLEGAGNTTIVKPSSAERLTTVLDGLCWDGTSKNITGIVVANATSGSGVTVKNLKVDESLVSTKPAGADYLTGILYRETGGTVDTVTVAGTGNWSGGDRAYGMYLSAETGSVTVEVKGSTITNFDKNGIEAMGSGLTANIHHNTITGRDSVSDEVQNGINIGRNATATISDNIISSMSYSPLTWWSAGVIVVTGGQAEVISNTVNDCQIGVIFYNGSGEARGNTIDGGEVALLGLWAQYDEAGQWTANFTGNTVMAAKDEWGYGLDEDDVYQNAAIGVQSWNEGASVTFVADSNTLVDNTGTTADGIYIGDIPEFSPAGNITATITGNTISGWEHGIRLVSSVASGSTITGNNISNNLLPDSGIHIDPQVDPTNVAVHFNNISGNLVYGIYNGGAGALNATHNWWGDVSGPSGEGYGTGDAVSANVTYSPWLDAPYPYGEEIYFVGAKRGAVSDGILDATDEADTEVAVNGTATVTVGQYSGNPGADFSGDIGKYIDVHIDSADSVTAIEIRLYYTDAKIAGLDESSLKLLWWNGEEWVECSDSGVNTTDVDDYSGYIWARITAESIPSLGDLVGTAFGGGGFPPAPPVVGGKAYPVNKLAILAPWIALSAAIIAATTVTMLRRRKPQS